MDFVILHGTMGTPHGNWFPWLALRLRGCGHDVYVPSLPTPDGQSKDNWCAALRDQAPVFGADTTLIGHSCGATFLLHILEVVRNPVHRSVFVSPVMGDIDNEEYDALNASFVHHGFDWETIKANAGDTRIFHGDNDPYVPRQHPEKLARMIGCDIDWVGDGGHLNAESGYTKFDLLYTTLMGDNLK